MSDTGAQGERARWWRLLLALLLSLSVHLGVIYGVRLVPAQQLPEAVAVIQARLQLEPDFSVRSAPAVKRTVPVKPAPASEATSRTPVRDVLVPAPVVQPKPERITPAPAEPASESGHEMPDSGHETALPVPDQDSALPKVAIPLFEDPTYYPAKQLDERPQAKRPVNPVYPDAAAVAGVEGEVMLLLLIDETGKVRDVSVVEAKPEGYFEESAMVAFHSAEFTPAIKQGRRVKSRVLIRVQYNLAR
jgi:protein TonB